MEETIIIPSTACFRIVFPCWWPLSCQKCQPMELPLLKLLLCCLSWKENWEVSNWDRNWAFLLHLSLNFSNDYYSKPKLNMPRNVFWKKTQNGFAQFTKCTIFFMVANFSKICLSSRGPHPSLTRTLIVQSTFDINALVFFATYFVICLLATNTDLSSIYKEKLS